LIAKGDGYIVTAKSEVEFVAIIFNYKYLNDLSRLRDQYRDLSSDISNYLEDLDDLVVSLRLNNVQDGRYKVRQHILNSRFGSVLDAWKRLSWVEDLHRSDVNWLDRVCIPALKIDFLDCHGTLPIECVLEPNEVRLLEFSLFLS
jgi:beta-xylosidase